MDKILAEIITIGDEILYGQITDTNSQWMSEKLDELGIKTIRKTTVGDNEKEILTVLEEAEERAQIILITGGLGPTKDDLTKPCLAKYFNSAISINHKALQELTELFESRGYELTTTNRRQAELPDKCTMISNKIGSAPGMWFDKDQKVFVSMPGVPHEMKTMMKNHILPKLREVYQTPTIVHRMIKTIGIGESWLSDKIENWESNLPDNIRLAYLPGLMQVKLRLTGIGEHKEVVKQKIGAQIDGLIPMIEKHVYGYDDDKIEKVVGKILSEQNLTISTAESCTGGFIAHTLTSVPGSSDYFMGGIIPYDNQRKIELLGVRKETIDNYGAVSEETVTEMASKVRSCFKTDIGIATSGIAGPGGGTKDKPVGTIWIALSYNENTITRKLQLGDHRLINIKRTTISALYLIWQSLTKTIEINS